MQAAVDELKKINLIARPARRMDVQMLAPIYLKEDCDDSDYAVWYEQGGEEFEEAVAAEDPEVLFAFGKGGWQTKGNGKGKGLNGGKGFGNGKGKGKDKGKYGKGDGKTN